MTDLSSRTVLMQQWIDRLRAGDASARNELLNCACERLESMARQMLKGFPSVRRWEQTDDVFQNAILRLWRALEEVTPRDVCHFFRLAAVEIRRELIDLARHYYGPQGAGAHHVTQARLADSESGLEPCHEPFEVTADPGQAGRMGGVPRKDRRSAGARARSL